MEIVSVNSRVISLKQKAGIILVILSIVGILIINIFTLIFVPFLSENTHLLWMSGSRLIFTSTEYVFLAVLIYLNKDKLGEFHLDRFSLITLILFGVIFRIRPIISGQSIFLFLIFISCLVIFTIIIRQWTNIKIPIGKISSKEIFLAVIILFLLIVVESFQPNLYNRVDTYNPFIDIIKRTYRNITSIATIEEIVYRGFLWGYLIQFGWSEKKVVWTQGILFWLIHFNRIFYSPLTFFISIPINIFFLTYLIRKTRQVFWPIMFHTASNVIVPVVLTTYYLN
jgi:membrane protease YdiL (CAAX protease family)